MKSLKDRVRDAAEGRKVDLSADDYARLFDLIHVAGKLKVEEVKNGKDFIRQLNVLVEEVEAIEEKR